ncbi:hypothetical protein QBE53_06190 [Vallitaleaceae bacterium 9-2]
MNGLLMELIKAVPYGVLAYLFTKTAYKDIDKTRNSLLELHKTTVSDLKDLATNSHVDIGGEISKQLSHREIVKCPIAIRE